MAPPSAVDQVEQVDPQLTRVVREVPSRWVTVLSTATQI